MYQFIHIETYARSASKKTKPTNKLSSVMPGGAHQPKGMDAFTKADGSQGKKGKSTIRDVIAEALRNEDHCAHVANPMFPTYLVGDLGDLLCLDYEIEKKCAAEKTRTGKAPRKDMHVLLAGVASFPRELAAQNPAGHESWEKATVTWLRDKYGDNLRAVLRHDDETHPHIHFFVCDRTRLNAKELHDGYTAVAHLPASKAISKEATQVFNDAMRDFQSDYYAKVGHGAGLLRDGPKRLRLDRATYKARKREAQERVKLDAEVSQVHGELLNGAAVDARKAATLRREVEHEARALAFERVELTQLRESTQRDRAAVDAEWSKASAARASAAEVELDAARMRSDLDKQLRQVQGLQAATEEAKAEAALATVARDREADALRAQKTEAAALGRLFKERLAGLGAVEDVRALLRNPKLVTMVEFIDRNPKVRELLDVLKAEPFLTQVMVESAHASRTLGLGEQPITWEPSQEVSHAARFLQSLDEGEASQVVVSGMRSGG